MGLAVQYLLNALQVGSVYALIALGYTMVYGILTMINFAHGDIFMVSTYIAFFVGVALLGSTLHLGAVPVFLATLLAAVLGTATLAAVIERVAYKPLRQAPRVSAVITALGVGLFLENFTLATIGPEPRFLPPLVPVGRIVLGGVVISTVQAQTIVLSALVMLLLDAIVRRTMTGMAMRAVSWDKFTAPLMGVPVDRIITLTFALGASIAAVGGVLYGMAYTIDPYMGIRIGWWAFISAVVGGIGNIRGAMIGGYILGAVEIFTPILLPSTYRDFVAFSLLLVFLIFRPTGILGRPVAMKV
ncbi:MAG: branched-chain amino acid ABC transporter permease [Armatimonadota bacterium]|nr:branched-chain amino acid ABC transporter permease [Armatimonadota bacterium]MDR7428468.1 branched-chain amino acid ABC transporter permease [Armatimonadota bacterium]MDR7465362.1 branched-chain amino acid ABC transporter permease [Armatimonadota bacterium]MDR7470813.1 branched-chain amino acid ABC transporter permease [Armatimonadota bacterium]MDR7475252.1 branched-chain amino acid ABC transporter permease [Armatimonadota bacterium]